MRKEMIITSYLKNPNRITTGDCSKTPGSFRAFIEQKPVFIISNTADNLDLKKSFMKNSKRYCLQFNLINNVGKHYRNTGYGLPHGFCVSKTPGSFRGVSGVKIINHIH